MRNFIILLYIFAGPVFVLARRHNPPSTERRTLSLCLGPSHLPYKVVRCETPSELARDAGGKKQSAEVRAAVKAAEEACMKIVLSELVRID